MPSMADAFLRLRVDQSQVQKDTQAGLNSVDTTSAGKKAGASYGGSFSKQVTSSTKGTAGKVISDADARSSGSKAGTSFGSELRASITKALSGFSLSKILGGGGEGDNAATKTLNSGGILGGLLPGIAGLSGLKATIVGIGGAAVAALPAVTALGAGFVGIGGAVSAIALGAKTLIGTKQDMGPLYAQAQAVAKSYEATMQTAAQSMLVPLRNAMGQLPALLKSIQPAISSVFAGAGTLIAPLLTQLTYTAQDVLPLLGGAFRAVAPLVTPLLTGIRTLVVSILPPMVTLIRAAQPAFNAFASILTTLGGNLGKMFTSFTPVIAASSTILRTLLDVLTAILPIVGSLAGVLASALAPVFGTFAAAVKAVLPALTTVGGVIASLAGAVLTDLSGVFSSLARFVADIAPSLNILGKALAQSFAVLENSGVFAILGDAVERLVPVIAQLVNTLVTGLAPSFPQIIQAASQLSTILVSLLTAGLTQVLTAVTPLVAVLASSASSLITWLNNTGALVPVLAALLAVTKGWTIAVATAKGAMVAWGAIMTAFNILTDYQTIALKAMYGWDLLIAAATKAWAIAQAALDLVMDAGIIGLVVVAVVALAAALVEAWQHSATFRDVLIDTWHGIQAAWSAAGAFFAQVGAALVAAWGTITAAWGTAVAFFAGIVASVTGVFTGFAGAVTGEFDKIMTFVTSSFDTWWAANGAALEKIWSALWGAISAVATAVWGVITAVAQAGWAALVALFTLEWAGLTTVWNAGWAVISAVVTTVWSVISTIIRTAWQVIVALFTADVQILQAAWSVFWAVLQAAATVAWSLITNAVKVAWAGVQLVFTTEIAVIQGVWSVFWAVLKAAAAVFWAAIQAAVKVAWDVVVGLFTVAINLLTGNWHGAWVAMQTMFTQVWNAIEAFLRTTLTAIESVLTTAWTTVQNTIRSVWGGIQSYLSTVWGAIRSVFSTAVAAVASVLATAWSGISKAAQAAFNGLKSALSTIWGGIKSVLEAPITAVVNAVINPFIGGIDTVLSWVGIKGIPKIPGFAAGGLLNLAAGGRLPGYGGGDRRMIMAEDGETVVSKTTSKAMAPLFGAYGVPGYAGGGIVGDIISSIPGASAVIDATKFISGDVLKALDVIGNAAGQVAAAVGSGNVGHMIGDIATKVVTAPVAKVESLVKSKILGPVTSFLSSLLAPAPGSPQSMASIAPGVAAAQKYALGLVEQMWPNSSTTNYSSLVALWNGESGWNYQADNPSSGAYGIPQALPADKMASAGADWKTNAATQIRWGLGYIQSVYGSPNAALTLWESRNPHWYREGGQVGPYGGRWQPKTRRYANGGSIPEPVIGLGARSGAGYQFDQGEEVASTAALAATSSKLDAIESAVNRLNSTTSRVPAGVGKSVGGALGGSASDAAFRGRYPRKGW
jgi:phage-related protein